MLLSDGMLTVCQLKDVADNGDMPKERLIRLFSEYYGERTVGFSRMYAARGVGEQVDMLVRIPYNSKLTASGCYAIIEGEQYRITMVQKIRDEGLMYQDLTLERMDKNYELDFQDKKDQGCPQTSDR